jgi:hypothetical protein
MDEKITPTCRYNHGDLVRQNYGSNEKLFYKVDTFPLMPSNDPQGQFIQFVVYSFAIYKCPHCSYMELHDEV